MTAATPNSKSQSIFSTFTLDVSICERDSPIYALDALFSSLRDVGLLQMLLRQHHEWSGRYWEYQLEEKGKKMLDESVGLGRRA